ncbi:ARID DNA-binding domain-containing protein [Tanacetum coccineum]|uniref:ARID DNA-binding domain-containing protein n=1 Tax=Tanacetum coccineum TaxID=301880 RepID=A0ABQ5H8H7_9ASTR
MVNTNSFLEANWSSPNLGLGYPNSWYQSKSGRPMRKKIQQDFILRQMKREKEARLGKCIKQITNDCRNMLRKKLEEIELYNSTISHNKYKRHKCFLCKQRGHIQKLCPEKIEAKDERAETHTREIAKEPKELPKPTKPSVELKYPECIHFQTKGILKGTDQGQWDDFWYLSNNTDKHLCYKLNSFCNIKENFMVNKLDDQRKFLFTYGMGEVLIKNDGQGYLIPGVHYAPEVTLNILSIDLLEKQGFEILYDGERYSLEYMFKEQKGQNLDEDNLRQMHNKYLEEYFESLNRDDTSMEEDWIRIKGNIYSTRVYTFNEYVAFLNLIKQDEIVSQEWDLFRKRFDKVVKWFYNHYLEKSLPGPIPPIINGVKIYLFDLYKLVEGLGGYLSVYFGQEFGTIGEILGLSKGNGEEIKKCYIKYLDVFTSYYKTARVPQQGYKSILKKPTRDVEEGRDCLMSHQCDFGETFVPTAVYKGKEKLEHFGIKLENIEDEKDNQVLHPTPIQTHDSKGQYLQSASIGPSTSKISDKEDSYNSTSDDFTIIT